MRSTGRLIPHRCTGGIDWTFLVLRGKSLKLVGRFIFNPLAFHLQKRFFMICCCWGYHVFCLLTRACCVLLQIHKYRLNTGFSVCIWLKNSDTHWIKCNTKPSQWTPLPFCPFSFCTCMMLKWYDTFLTI